jgi:hypothetical protein
MAAPERELMFHQEPVHTRGLLRDVHRIVAVVELYVGFKRNHPTWLNTELDEDEAPTTRNWSLCFQDDTKFWGKFLRRETFHGKEYLVFVATKDAYFEPAMQELTGLFPKAMLQLEDLYLGSEGDEICVFLFLDASGPSDQPAPGVLLFPAEEDVVITSEWPLADDLFEPVRQQFEASLQPAS